MSMCDLILENALDLLFITETWLDNTSNPIAALATQAGYKISCLDRKVGRGGGIAILYRDKMSFHNEDTNVWGDRLWILVYTSRPISREVAHLFIVPLARLALLKSCAEAVAEQALRSLHGPRGRNLHLDQLETRDSIDFLDLLNLAQLPQWECHPTHQGGHILDTICSNFAIQVDQPLPVGPLSHLFFLGGSQRESANSVSSPTGFLQTFTLFGSIVLWHLLGPPISRTLKGV